MTGPSLDVDDLIRTTGRFAREVLRPVALAYDESEEHPSRELRHAAELELTCYDIPAAYGGGGVEGLSDAASVVEELAWVRVPSAW